MKILHVWDQAGVACILAKYQRKLGHDVLVMKRLGYDPFQVFQFYGLPLLDLDGKSFLNQVTKKAREYDIIHVHSISKIIPDLRKRYPNKTIILHYHGSDVRGAVKTSLQLSGEELSDAIIGSTEDLQPHVGSKMLHVPNPVDTEHFRPTRNIDCHATDALTFKTTDSDTNKIIALLKESGIELSLKIVDRQSDPVPYSEMPHLISGFRTYVDLKFVRGKLLHAPSKTGLECLACGLRVLNYKMEYTDNLPEVYMPEKCAATMLAIYDNVRH
jgi:hypothetical protein